MFRRRTVKITFCQRQHDFVLICFRIVWYFCLLIDYCHCNFIASGCVFYWSFFCFQFEVMILRETLYFIGFVRIAKSPFFLVNKSQTYSFLNMFDTHLHWSYTKNYTSSYYTINIVGTCVSRNVSTIQISLTFICLRLYKFVHF